MKEKLVDSLFIVERTDEINSFLILLKEAYSKKEKKTIIIKGPMGSGKSLFIRHSFYKLLNDESNFHKSFFDVEKKKIVFCTYQTPISRLKPLNGFYKIFREMYNYLVLFYEEKMNLKNYYNENFDKNSFEKSKKFTDEIINIILDENCFYLIKYLELILKQDLIKIFEEKYLVDKKENNNDNNNINVYNNNYNFTLDDDQREKRSKNKIINELKTLFNLIKI
jgi:Cdc6-like AAA superfamily ATPase